MPFRPTSCACAGYTSPSFDPRVQVGPGPHPKRPTDLGFLKDLEELEKRIETSKNLNGTQVGYVGEGEAVPTPEDAEKQGPFKLTLECDKLEIDLGDEAEITVNFEGCDNAKFTIGGTAFEFSEKGKGVVAESGTVLKLKAIRPGAIELKGVGRVGSSPKVFADGGLACPKPKLELKEFGVL